MTDCPHRWTPWLLKQATLPATGAPTFISSRTCLACSTEQLSQQAPTPTRLKGILIGLALFALSATVTVLLLMSLIPA